MRNDCRSPKLLHWTSSTDPLSFSRYPESGAVHALADGEIRGSHDDLREDFNFVSALKACAREQDLRRGTWLHAAISQKGLLGRSPYLVSSLINMYAKCGEIEKAQAVLDDRPFRDAVSWNALIAGYCQHGQGHDALCSLQRMVQEAACPDSVTLICCLKACGTVKAIEKGKQIHGKIARSGFLEMDIMIGTSLIDMYVRCGVVVKAQQVLKELPYVTVVSWNALISGFAQQSDCDEALSCIERMRGEGLCPDVITFTCILKACGSIIALNKGKQIHTEIICRQLLDDDIAIGNALVDMYSTCGIFLMAQNVLEQLLIRDVLSWNAIIAGYMQHDKFYEVLNCFDQMQIEDVLPNVATFVYVLRACGSIRAIKTGERIHELVANGGLLGKDVILGNAITDMYVKCGMLHRAEKIFENLSFRDAVSWNILLAGYVQEGQAYKCLDCYEHMLVEGMSPNLVTFICILKACGFAKSIKKIEQFHHEIVCRGFLGTDVVLDTTLVDAYSKCGMSVNSLELFQEIPVRNVVSWSALIAGYAERGQIHEAFNCLDKMHNQGLSPDAITFISLLKACGSTGDIDRGKQIHDFIATKDLLQKDFVLGNALVDMYAKCGDFSKAREVLEQLPFRNEVSWNVLIAGHIKQGRHCEALRFFEQMQNEGLSPDDVTIICILKACSNVGAIDMGRKLHYEIACSGLLHNNISVANVLVNMYVKFGLFEQAQQLLEELHVRDVISWNTLIAGYSQQGSLGEALNCFERMQNEDLLPDAISFACILKACGMNQALDKGEQIHDDVVSWGLLKENIVLGNALIGMYVNFGMLSRAQKVFDELPFYDVVSWNTLIAGYTAQKQGHETLRCFEQMQNEGLSPDAATFTCALKACTVLGDINEGKRIHKTILNGGWLKKDLVIGNALVDMYAKCGIVADAVQVFEELPIRNIVTWSSVIALYAQEGQVHEALYCFEQMQSEGLSPDGVAFLAILKACSGVCAIDKGEEIHNMISHMGLIENDFRLLNALVDMYSKCCLIRKAWQVLEQLVVRTTVSWNAFIAGYAWHGQGCEALNCFEQMQIEGICPDEVTFLCVLSACSRSGLLGEAQIIFESMSKKYGITPNLKHLSCMVATLGFAGQFDKAISVIKLMPHFHHLVVWLVMLDSCRKWGKVKLGILVFDQAVQVNSDCFAAYVIMANIFADAGMQKDAENVELARKKYAVWKRPDNNMSDRNAYSIHMKKPQYIPMYANGDPCGYITPIVMNDVKKSFGFPDIKQAVC